MDSEWEAVLLRSQRWGVRALVAGLMALMTMAVSPAAMADARKAVEAIKRQDYAGAMAACRDMAVKGDAACQNEVGNLYRFGWGVPVNHPEALRWYRAAADQQHAWARVNLGHMLRLGQGSQADPAQAMQLFQDAARQGNAHALNAIGDLHAAGQGVRLNRSKACEFYDQAAQKGDSWGMSNQAHCLRDGVGGRKPDLAGAIALAQKAAQQGNPGAMVLLGQMLFRGQGAAADPEQAERWLKAATENTLRLPWVLRPANESLGDLYYLPRPFGLGPDPERAKTHYEQAAKLGSAAALAGLATIYRLGTTATPKDFPKALDYYLRSLRLEQSARAYVGIALLYLNGSGVPEDPSRALGYFARAMQFGSGEARFQLGRMYEQGKGVSKDLEVAKWYMEDALKRSGSLHPNNRKLAEAFLSKHASIKAKEPAPLLALSIESSAATTVASPASATPPTTVTLAPAPAAPPVVSAKRKALVIGIDKYRNVDRLNNAVADARAISQALTQIGYTVSTHYDLDERQFKAALRDFKLQLDGGDEALFFFAGHGVQLAGANYLLPADIRKDSEDQVRDESIQLQRILDDLNERKPRFSLAIIDACRDNPFKGAGRAIGGRGLASTTAASGQMILFAAGSGQQALDRLSDADRNPNSIFTRVFLEEMKKPGLSVDRVLRNVRGEVVRLARSVGHEQIPALYDQAVGEFYFR